MPEKNPRLSLPKTQIQAGVGAELLALCQTVTADGVLTDAEIAELRAWIAANRSADLPAIGFLVATLERILADGKVTEEERRELYGTIEKVLPPEARREAVAQRKAVEAEQKEQDRRERDTRKQQEREDRERRRPIYFMDFMVAGVHYEGRPEVIRLFAREGAPVFLARDPANPYSRNAIEVRLANGMQIGFVPEEFAPDAAPFLDRGCPHMARIKKILRGGRVPIPVVEADIYRPDAGVEGMVFPADVPRKTLHTSQEPEAETGLEFAAARPRAKKAGCLGTLLLAAATLAFAQAVKAQLLPPGP